MPLTHTRRFRIRRYECDAYGHLNNANYLRFMQETAFDASAAGGYTMQRYNEINRYWLIRETGIEYLCPLRYEDVVEVKTWIADFRRASSRRAYEFRFSRDGQLAARAYTDWVFLNTTTGQPASIPPELRHAFYPEGMPASFPSRQPYPKAPPPPEGVFKMRRRVAWNDIDQLQHVNNAVYLNYITECSMQVLVYHGWSWQRMATEGFGIFLRRNHIQYLQPALLDDELEIATWASNVRRATANRHYVLRRVSDGALIAQATTYSVWVDLKNGQPMRIPAGFLHDFTPNIV
jgi:acyl-CoA thioester hydrolase